MRQPLWIGRRGPLRMRGKDITPFAMGGAGYCLNWQAAQQMGEHNLVTECDRFEQPDDMSIGMPPPPPPPPPPSHPCACLPADAGGE